MHFFPHKNLTGKIVQPWKPGQHLVDDNSPRMLEIQLLLQSDPRCTLDAPAPASFFPSAYCFSEHQICELIRINMMPGLMFCALIND